MRRNGRDEVARGIPLGPAATDIRSEPPAVSNRGGGAWNPEAGVRPTGNSAARAVPLLKREFPVQDRQDLRPVILSCQAPCFGGIKAGIRTVAHLSFRAR